MKFLMIVVVLFSSFVATYSQNDIELRLQKEREIYDCNKSAYSAIEQIPFLLKKYEMDSVGTLLNEIIVNCGFREWMLRVSILVQIYQNNDSIAEINTYIDENFEVNYIDRIEDSKDSSYFKKNQFYSEYNIFPPLRHPLDSATQGLALELLKREDITNDERIICLLFANDVEMYEKEIKNLKAVSSIAEILFFKKYYSRRNEYSGAVFLGSHTPIGNSKIFGTSPSLKVAFSLMNSDLSIDFLFGLRLNNNNKKFAYEVNDNERNTSSYTTEEYGVTVGVPIYRTSSFILMPKIGYFHEKLWTNIAKRDSNNEIDEDSYYSVDSNSGYLAVAITNTTIPTLGFELGFKYSNFNSDKHLKTKFYDFAFCTNLFVRF